MELFDFTFKAMTTSCKVKLYAKDQKKAEHCFLEIQRHTLLLEKKYNFHDSKSYLNREINNRKRNRVTIDAQTFSIIKEVRALSEATQGVFDITMGTLKDCYDHSSVKKIEACLAKRSVHVGLETWFLKDKKLHFKDLRTKFDLGGVIKEYAVDEAVKIAQTHGIKTALINFGGDMYGYGKKPDGDPFFVAIKNPKTPEEHIAIVPVDNQALTTSAHYERYKEVEGENFSHIFSQESMRKEIISSSVLSDTTIRSGVYSTALMLTNRIEIPKDLGVLLIDQEMRIHQNLL
ncbi:MAG: FAD:protein FMN transferase [Epsilonproteobacteria bacterium]|nr:FAD:protein FMN transferase [Campylobacterota bacterium]